MGSGGVRVRLGCCSEGRKEGGGLIWGVSWPGGSVYTSLTSYPTQCFQRNYRKRKNKRMIFATGCDWALWMVLVFDMASPLWCFSLLRLDLVILLLASLAWRRKTFIQSKSRKFEGVISVFGSTPLWLTCPSNTNVSVLNLSLSVSDTGNQSAYKVLKLFLFFWIAGLVQPLERCITECQCSAFLLLWYAETKIRIKKS